MEKAPGFGAMLARLLSRKGLSAGCLARRIGIPESDLQAVLDGAAPDGSLIWRLAPELGLHVADLFVIAGMPVPEDLAPVDAGIGRLVARFVLAAMELPPESRAQVLDFLRSLPQQDGTQSVPVVRDEVYERFPPGLGKVLVLMLRNRNFDWLPATELIYRAGGPILSGSMIGSVGLGRKEVTPRLLAAFATVLGIPIGDLAAIGGLEYQFSADPADLDGGDMAALVWEARRLTAEQVRRAGEQIPPRRL
jgi:hypothetical protein